MRIGAEDCRKDEKMKTRSDENEVDFVTECARIMLDERLRFRMLASIA